MAVVVRKNSSRDGFQLVVMMQTADTRADHHDERQVGDVQSMSFDGLGRREIQGPTRNVVAHGCSAIFNPSTVTASSHG